MTHQHVSRSCLKGGTVPSATLLPKNVTIYLFITLHSVDSKVKETFWI
jgi:hypothetical protein